MKLDFIEKLRRKSAEKRFKRAAERLLAERYGDRFTWSAAFTLGTPESRHVFSAAADDLSAVCELIWPELTETGELTDETVKRIKEAAFCLSVLPAGTQKLLLLPRLCQKGREDTAFGRWLAENAFELGSAQAEELLL